MSGYLAFDRDGSPRWPSRLIRSLDELDRCRPDDPAATDADDAIRRAVDRLGPWVLRLAGRWPAAVCSPTCSRGAGRPG